MKIRMALWLYKVCGNSTLLCLNGTSLNSVNTLLSLSRQYSPSTTCSTVEPRYNEVLGTMKITLLYQVSHYIRVKKQRNIKNWDQQNYLVIRGFVISDLVITRFHCIWLSRWNELTCRTVVIRRARLRVGEQRALAVVPSLALYTLIPSHIRLVVPYPTRHGGGGSLGAIVTHGAQVLPWGGGCDGFVGWAVVAWWAETGGVCLARSVTVVPSGTWQAVFNSSSTYHNNKVLHLYIAHAFVTL